jgi:Zn-dependent metalloprotease
MEAYRMRACTSLGLGLVLLLAGSSTTSAQVGRVAIPAPNRGIAALTADDIAQSSDLIGRLMQTGDLRSFEIHDDPMLPGRRHETLRQFYRGLPVEGAAVTRQMTGGATLSIFGALDTDIAIDTTPAFSAVDAARLIERAAGRPIAFGASPALVVLPTPGGSYVLAYKATVEDAVTYFLDAMSGQVLKVANEKMDDVGVGTGVLGDSKKLSTTQSGAVFRTRDALRPAVISTFDTGGSSVTFNRLMNGVSSDNDLASDSDNTWTDSRIVDAHVHTGWVYDYFFRRFNWSGLDGQNRAMSAVVHRGLKNNAAFYPAPFGPGGNGAMVYGDTTAGVPVTALDVAGHELMHGVTFFSLVRRTGQGLASSVLRVESGPSSFTYQGQTFSCTGTVLVDADDTRHPFWCNAGKFVMGTNDSGAVNEAFSDIFGTSVEFFDEPAGTGPLKADYLMAEDIPVFGPNRSLSNPGSIRIAHDAGSVPYPDNLKGTLHFALVILQGTEENPTSIGIAPVAFVNGSSVTFLDNGLTDSGGVHLNATVLGHAFYLAIEGGRNATSGLSVTGVGAQNRELVERAFFRAMTQLMPNVPSQSTAALAVYQASVDLYGVTGATTQAIAQAMIAVGLLQ